MRCLVKAWDEVHRGVCLVCGAVLDGRIWVKVVGGTRLGLSSSAGMGRGACDSSAGD